MKHYERAELTMFLVAREDVIATSILQFLEAEGNEEAVFDGRSKFIPNS